MKRNFIPVLFLGILALLTTSQKAEACSEIAFKKAPAYQISARNFDFMTGEGFIRFSPAGTSKQSQYVPAGGQPLKWTSRYPSITFDTVMPKSASPGDGFYYGGVDGLNLAGLKIGTYFLATSKFPNDASKTSIDICSLMEYLLDNFSSVDEAVKDLQSGRYIVTSTPTGLLEITLHLLLHDASGKSAVVEFLDGKVEVIPNPELLVITNTIYSDSLDHLKLYSGFGGEKTIPGTNDSLDRFVRGAFYLQHLDFPEEADTAVKYGFALIQTVSVSPKFAYGSTQWTVVTDIEHRMIYFRTLSNPNVLCIDLNKLAESGKLPCRFDLLKTGKNGDITELLMGKIPQEE